MQKPREQYSIERPEPPMAMADLKKKQLQTMADSKPWALQDAVAELENGAMRANQGKLRYDLLPPHVLAEIIQVLTAGAAKYGDRNWERGFNYTSVYASAMRHLQAWRMGEDHDQESSLHHLAHCICNLVFLLHFHQMGTGVDDRRSNGNL